MSGPAAGLSKDEWFLLEWLSKEDVSQYGECYGAAFDELERKGLVQLNGSRNHPRVMFLGCGLTESGRAAVKARGDQP